MSESSAASDATAAEPAEAAAQEPEAEVFLNRADRRAKGKKSSAPEVFTKGQRPTGRGSVQSPRQYGNRRSG